MTVPMPVSVSAPASMRMSVMPACRNHTDKVDSKSYCTDSEELAGVHLGRVEEALDGFKDDEDRDEAEEDAVCEAGEGLDTGVAGGGRGE